MDNLISLPVISTSATPADDAGRTTGTQVRLDVASGLEVRIRFTAPPQPSSHTLIRVGPLTWGRGSEPFIRRAVIYDDGKELGYNLAENFLPSAFADASSRFAHERTTGVIDFSTFADGVKDGLVTLRLICGAGYCTFDPTDLRVIISGENGMEAGYEPVITNVDICRSASMHSPQESGCEEENVKCPNINGLTPLTCRGLVLGSTVSGFGRNSAQLQFRVHCRMQNKTIGFIVTDYPCYERQVFCGMTAQVAAAFCADREVEVSYYAVSGKHYCQSVTLL